MKEAEWMDAVRPSWDVIVPPNLEESERTYQEWKTQNFQTQLYWEKHCPKHHKLFVANNEERTISQAIKEDLKVRLELNSQPAPRPVRIFYAWVIPDDELEGDYE